MNAKDFISKRERRLLLAVAFVGCLLIIVQLSSEFIWDYNFSVCEEQQRLESLANFGREGVFSSSAAYTFPLFHLLLFFIFLALLKTKRFLRPLFLTSFYAVVLIFSLSERYAGVFSEDDSFFERIHFAAIPYDYIAALFISILFFWQISILLRIFIKTLQRKTDLP